MLQRLLTLTLYLTLIILTIAHPALFDREKAFLDLTLLLAVLFVATCIQRVEWPSFKRLSPSIQIGAAIYLLSGLLSVQTLSTSLFFCSPSSCS